VAELALVLWSVYGLLAVVLPVALQLRRTGSTGLAGLRGNLGSVEWLAGAGLVAAIALGVTAAVLAVSDAVEPVEALDRTAVHVVGIALYALGLGWIVFSQQWMGRSWRIGVDERERTQLVTGGPFRFVRNPIFTGMIALSAGLALLVPSVVSFVALAVLIVSLEVQIRLVEEPYLRRVHGQGYERWAQHTGRLVPGLGRFT
jgi:protein-S-isoprenylcysteine O-methyltransferase Ste14